MALSELTSRIPYLLRAMHEWIIDNNQTPYIVVDANVRGVDVPEGYAVDDRIVLNISHDAVENLNISNTAISFEGRFAGVSRHILLPSMSILGIYAKESGEGMIFASEQLGSGGDEDPPPSGGKPSLRVVK